MKSFITISFSTAGENGEEKVKLKVQSKSTLSRHGEASERLNNKVIKSAVF